MSESAGGNSSASAGQSTATSGGESTAAKASEGVSEGVSEGSAEVSTETTETNEAPQKKAADDKSEESTEEKAEPKETEEADKETEKPADDKAEKPEGEDSPEASELQTLREYQKKNREANKRVAAVINDNPEVAGIIRDMDSGADMVTALIRNIDTDVLKSAIESAENDGEYANEWSEAKKKREAKRSESEKFEKTLNDNREFTQKEYAEFAKEHEIDGDDAKAFIETLQDIVGNINSLKIDRKLMGMIRTAMNASKDIETARKQGETKARNEKIVATKEKDEGRNELLPDMDAGGGATPVDMTEVLNNPMVRSIDRFNAKQRF